MSWLIIRPRPMLLTAFRSEGGRAAVAAFGMSAPKVRQTHSLGREPQVPGISTPGSPRKGATDCGCGVSRSHHLPLVCRRFAA